MEKPENDLNQDGDEVLVPPAPPVPSAEEVAKIALEEWKNKALYLSAEIDNMQKRFAREKVEIIKFASEDLIKNLLPVLDNLHLALKAFKSSSSKMDNALLENSILKNLVTGFEMTAKHFEQTFERLGIVALESVGKVFDPNFHEAMGDESKPEFPENTVTQEFTRGYLLHGRLLRAARVFVNKLSN